MNYIKESFLNLRRYCEAKDFKGFDPYDGLNSRVFKSLPFLKDNRYFRLLWIQLFKRFPINLRKAFLIPEEFNPKALSLFLSGYCNLYAIKKEDSLLEKINFLLDKLLKLKSEGYSGACWGYNFDWQAKAFYQPRYTPTVVVSSFVGSALLDAFDVLKEPHLLDEASSVCDFILKDLNRTYDSDGDFAFSYSPLDKSVVFNACLLGVKQLCRVYWHIGNSSLIDAAKKAVSFCCKHQGTDGFFRYGKASFHRFVDSFHTGYNLECLKVFQDLAPDTTFKRNIELGLKYYLDSFFTDTGIPKYYNNSVYPVDVHCPAEFIVVLYRLGCLNQYKHLVEKVLKWTIDNMQDEKGFFYYQMRPFYTCKIAYMRWTQAWMFYALSFYLRNESQLTS